MTPRRAAFAALTLLAAGTAYAQELGFRSRSPAPVISAREAGYGGQHAAYSNDIFVLFNNPAALSITRQGIITGFAAGMSLMPSEIQNLADILRGGAPKNADIEDAARQGLLSMPPEAQIAGPILFGIAGKSTAFGVFNRSYISAALRRVPSANNPGSDVVRYSANLNNDIFCAAGGAFNILDAPSHKIDAGGGAQLFFRNVIQLAGAEFISPEQKKAAALDEDTGAGNFLGASLNAGILYRGFDRFFAGFTARGIPAFAFNMSGEDESGTRSFLFMPVLNAGVAFKFLYSHQVTGTLMIDARDILRTALLAKNVLPTLLLGWSAGIEFVFLNMWTLSAGCDGLRPSAGIGCGLGALKVYVSVYGKDYGQSAACPSYFIYAGIYVTRD